jgi:hypothetical protein
MHPFRRSDNSGSTRPNPYLGRTGMRLAAVRNVNPDIQKVDGRIWAAVGWSTDRSLDVESWLRFSGLLGPDLIANCEARCAPLRQLARRSGRSATWPARANLLRISTMPLGAKELIQLALENLEVYAEHLKAQKPSDALAARVVGATDARELPLDLLEFVTTSIQSVLRDEQSYIDECRASLVEQLKWQGSKSGEPSLTPIKYAAMMKSIEAEKSESKRKELAKCAYYEPIRERLMGQGFLVAPRGAALGAVFPMEDWVTQVHELQFWSGLKERTDALVQNCSSST